jgi:hypothetical protein
MSQPQLSTVIVVGEHRERARNAIEAIAAQTAADSIELIVVDVCPQAPRLPEPGSPVTSKIVLPPSTPWGSLRAAGARASASPVIAFVEDHVIPQPGWAEALLQAHRQPWATVGYAFLSSDGRWSSRALLIAEYGLWAHPAAGGRSRLLPGNNVSYKRNPLLTLGADLDQALEIDSSVHRRFAAQGLEAAVEPGAIVRHHELAGVWSAASANCTYGRLLAVGRARDGGWHLPHRVLYSIAAPLGAPVVRAAHLARSLRGRRTLWRQAVTALPVATLIWLWSGIGQAIGYVFGPGDSGRRLTAWELTAGRSGGGGKAGSATPAT